MVKYESHMIYKHCNTLWPCPIWHTTPSCSNQTPIISYIWFEEFKHLPYCTWSLFHLIINGTLEKTLTGMRTDTVTNGTSCFFWEKCIMDHLSSIRYCSLIQPSENTWVQVCDAVDAGEAERMGRCIAAMQLAKKTVRVCVLSVLALSTVPGAGAACFLSWVEAVKCWKLSSFWHTAEQGRQSWKTICSNIKLRPEDS